MKTTNLFLAGFLTATCALAAPFNRSQVASDSKWFAHLDVEGFLQTDTGEFLVTMAREKLEQAMRGQDVPVTLQFDDILAEIRSITAYGSTFEDNPQKNSVLLIGAGDKLHAIIDGFLASQELANEESTAIRSLADKPFPTYLLGGEVFMGMPRKDLIMVSMDYPRIEQALAVIEGRTAGLAADSGLVSTGAATNFFLFAAAEGFSESKTMPPQARILQKARGARFALGEANGEVLTRLVLATTGPEVSSQLRRIIDGMIALLSFAETQNPAIARLTRSLAVTEDRDAVGISLRYPVAEIKVLTEALMSGRAAASRNPAIPVAPPSGDGIGGQVLRVSYTDARSDNGNLGRNATDGDPQTYWGAVGTNQWLRCELSEPSLVREVRIAWHEGDRRQIRFIVQASMDGVVWKPILSRQSSGTTTGPESYDVADTTARWIRILCPGRNPGILGISEISFIGEAGVAVTPPNPTQPASAP